MKPKQEHKEYKTRHVRLSEEVWEKLKQNRRESGLSWNLFIKSLSDETASTEAHR